VGLKSAAGNKLENMVCQGDPLSTLVKMGGRCALGVVHITCFIARGHEAPFTKGNCSALPPLAAPCCCGS
jgi:hypothetical protein